MSHNQRAHVIQQRPSTAKKQEKKVREGLCHRGQEKKSDKKPA